jgi:hypothetical protein
MPCRLTYCCRCIWVLQSTCRPKALRVFGQQQQGLRQPSVCGGANIIALVDCVLSVFARAPPRPCAYAHACVCGRVRVFVHVSAPGHLPSHPPDRLRLCRYHTGEQRAKIKGRAAAQPCHLCGCESLPAILAARCDLQSDRLPVIEYWTVKPRWNPGKTCSKSVAWESGSPGRTCALPRTTAAGQAVPPVTQPFGPIGQTACLPCSAAGGC